LSTKGKGSKAENFSPKQAVNETVISGGTKFNGTITTGEKLRIQGDFEGKIISKETVYIDRTGKVNADIFASNIIIAGAVVGDMQAKERFELLATGSVSGEVKAAKISIMDSASVKGKIEVGNIKEIPKLADANPKTE